MNVASAASAPNPEALLVPVVAALALSTASRALSRTLSRWKLSWIGASGKSTQNAFMFRPYKKAAKLSLKRASDSCISCRCIMFASRSAMLSLSSAKPGSSVSSGVMEELPP